MHFFLQCILPNLPIEVACRRWRWAINFVLNWVLNAGPLTCHHPPPTTPCPAVRVVPSSSPHPTSAYPLAPPPRTIRQGKPIYYASDSSEDILVVIVVDFFMARTRVFTVVLNADVVVVIVVVAVLILLPLSLQFFRLSKSISLFSIKIHAIRLLFVYRWKKKLPNKYILFLIFIVD